MKRYVLIVFMVLCSGCMRQITPAPVPAQSEGARYLLFIVHGSGNTAADWPADLVGKVKTVIPQAGQWDIVAYDWSTYAEDKLSAADAGIKIGTYIGNTLSSSAYHYERIQFVAHSVGSFVIQAACDAYRARPPVTPAFILPSWTRLAAGACLTGPMATSISARALISLKPISIPVTRLLQRMILC
jgi:pimeloyl-ACP methyl ester carboxylesterase